MQIGRHGIIISFRDKHNQMYSATYLPEVAAEQRKSWAVEVDRPSLVAWHLGHFRPLNCPVCHVVARGGYVGGARG